jgi:hypothetical protein
MDWNYRNEIFAGVDPTKGIKVKGFKCAGAHGIDLELDVRTGARQPNDMVDLVSLTGALSVGGATVAHLATHGNNLMGTATTERTLQAHLAAVLDLRQTTALDAAREKSGDLLLRLEVAGVASGQRGACGFQGADTVRVPQADWLKALSDNGYGSTLLVEVVVPRDVADPGMAAALQAMERALAKLRESGGETDAVAACRVAMDEANVGALAPGLRLDCGPNRNPSDLTQAERLSVLRYATKLITHPAHHTVQVHFSKEEALAVSQVAAALLAYEAKVR